MKLIFNGDSWTFGSEIADPEIAKQYSKDEHPGAYDYLEINDGYRIPRIHPHIMAKALDCDYINLAWPADDNKSIINRTISYITTEYIDKNIPTDDIFVIVGWTSPERNSFWWKSDEFNGKFRLWPNCPYFNEKKMKHFWEIYVEYVWHPEEYVPRHVSTISQFQNFCNVHNIKWLCYNAFYQTPASNVDEWADLDMKEEINNIKDTIGGYEYAENGKRKNNLMDYMPLWNTIDPVRFYKKDQPNSTFKSFIEANTENPFTGWHPSPEAHEAWAFELIRYIKENNLI